MSNSIPTKNYVLYFDKNKAHHLAFFQALLDRVEKYEPEALQKDGDLNTLWRAAVPSKPPLPASPAPGPSSPSGAPPTWASMTTMAKAAGAKFPELVAAQGALESGWYKHTSGVNNFFGLKGAGTAKETKEFVNGKWIAIIDSFIDFASVQECVNYLVERWYKDFKVYNGVNSATSREEAARMLVKEGYATDPEYANKLISLMNENTSSVVPAPLPPPLPPQQVILAALDPRGSEEAGLIGPKIKAPVKVGDSYLLVNDRDSDMEAYDYSGKFLWKIPCLAKGVGGKDWRKKNSDTPPGLYKIGQIYADYEENPNPPRSDEAESYGWYSFDMIELEGQEARNQRAGIMLHGGGSACGWPGAWAPKQGLHPTLGCLRAHNIDLRDRVLPLTKKGTVFIGVFQEP